MKRAHADEEQKAHREDPFADDQRPPPDAKRFPHHRRRSAECETRKSRKDSQTKPGQQTAVGKKACPEQHSHRVGRDDETGDPCESESTIGETREGGKRQGKRDRSDERQGGIEPEDGPDRSQRLDRIGLLVDI